MDYLILEINFLMLWLLKIVVQLKIVILIFMICMEVDLVNHLIDLI